MLRWIGTNLRTLFLAFALALAVWVSAITSADPDETRQYPNPISIELIGQDPGLVITGALQQSVIVSLRAPRSVWEKLISQENSIRAVADLSGFGSGTHTVAIQIQVGLRPVRVITVTPESFDLSLEHLVTHTLPIELSLLGEPAAGYQAADPKMDMIETVVSGPETLVSRVAHVRAVLDLTGIRQDINTAITLTAGDKQGITLTGVTLQPDQIHVTMPIAQLGGYRDLVVWAITFGQPASGYRLTNIASTPAVVTVFSTDPTLINTLPGYVKTESLDLTGANANIETHLNLILPFGVTLVSEKTVQVQVGISPIESSLTLTNLPVETSNLGTGLHVDIAPTLVIVIFSGQLPSLNSLSSANVRVFVDLKGLVPGRYPIVPKVDFTIQNVTVESILPGTIEVVISNAITPTP